jgi:PAS domain S-box-containing protein
MVVFIRPIKHPTFGLSFVVLPMLLILGLSLLAYAVVSPQGPSLPTPERIVLLYSYGDGIPAYQEATRAFLSVMKEGRVSVNNLFFEYLDLERNKDKEHKNNLVTLLRHKYAKEKVDLIVTVHTPALRFLLNEGRNLFPKTPVLSYLAPDIIETAGVEHQFLLLPMQMDFRGTLELAQRLFPKTMRVVFINGIGEGEKRLEREAKGVFLQWHDKLEFEYTSDLSVEEMLQRIATLPPRTIVIYSNVFTDKTGRTFVAKDVAERVAKAANAPVFGMYNTILGSGIIGGSMFNFEIEGARAAAMALDILKGKISLTKPVTILTASRIPMFDWPPLKRWGLDESALPPGSIVLNRPALGWEEHTLEIIGILAFCLVETALIIILIVQRRRRRSAEESLKQKTEELDQFFNISLDLLCIANTEGYFLRLNPVWEKILGYSCDELMSKRFVEFVHPDDVRSTIEAIAALASQKAVTYFMNRYKCKDGTYRWLEWSAAPIGNLIYAAARDVTERKLAQLALEERLRFEQLLSDLSARFLNIPPDRVDSEIEDGLRQILEFFQVDRCGLVRTLPGRSAYQITHAAYSEDVPPIPAGVELPISINPWAYEKLILKREVVAFSRLDDLPPEANVDKQTWAEWGIRSNVNIPILIGEPVDHIISINSVKRECVWPEEIIPRLRLLGEIFVNALDRKQIRLQIQERLRFETLISNLSAGFVNLPPDEVASEINKVLGSITEFFDADRCSIGLFSEDGTQLSRAFEYHSAEAEPAPESASKEQMPWYMDQLIRGNPVVMNRVEDLQPEAEKERQLCLVKGMKSVLSIPLVSGGRILGSCALVSTRAERVWLKEYVPRLRMIGEILVNALRRKEAEEASRESERILKQNEDDLRRLAGRLISAQEEERSRLARELHDDLAQRLAVFAIDVGRLEQQLMDPPAPVREELREMKNGIVKISQDVHSLSRQLHPSILDDLGLIKAVESECTNFSRREGIEIVFNHENIPRVIPKDVSLSLYRIIQEGLRNISKHACAEHISVSLKGLDHAVLLSVQDDGIGFDWAEVKENPGLGFSSMRERARLIHGELSIQSQPEKGTVITLRVPLTRE